MAENPKPPSFQEDSFDLRVFKKAQLDESRKKTQAKRAKWQVSLGKVILTAVALALFAILWYVIMSAISHFSLSYT